MDFLVSILIPVFNREKYISETIKSATNQSYENIEIIVVDNCSTDCTWDIIIEEADLDKRIKPFRNQHNLGPVKNWQICIEKASGTFAKVLFSDDKIEYNFISETIKMFDSLTSFVIGNIYKFDDFGNSKILSGFDGIDKLSYESYLYQTLFDNKFNLPISPGSALFRLRDLKSSLVLNIKNPFNLNYSKYGAGNDLLIFLNTAINYKEVKFCKKTCSYFRFHDDSLTVANDLTIYYDYAKYWFIQHNHKNLLNKFYTKLWLSNLKNGSRKNILSHIRGRIDYKFIFEYFFIKIFPKH